MRVYPTPDIAQQFSSLGAARRLDTLKEDILKCVHCGMCNATCPTYQITGDELDGPRGRIYQIKALLEGEALQKTTVNHLNLCLQCRSCETTCPSGVSYHRILENGQWWVRAQQSDSALLTLKKNALSALAHRAVSTPLMRLAKQIRPLLPAALQAKIPPKTLSSRRSSPTTLPPLTAHAPCYALFQGCVQEGLAPEINGATREVLAQMGIKLILLEGEKCCGALPYHLGKTAPALISLNNNINVWMKSIEAHDIQGVVINASGCTLMVREYGAVLFAEGETDPDTLKRAEKITQKIFEPSEILVNHTEKLRALLRGKKPPAKRLVFQSPCTSQHGMKRQGEIESWLQELLAEHGVELMPMAEPHLCCGSAGVYSVLQPAMSTALRARKWANINHQRPERVLTANIGCLTHLQGAGEPIPIQHYINFLAEWLNA